ncbi:alpha/beta fold hydrolase [Nocardiopsis sp. HNM0947]|uniref:Proline iminopeptidase n=1 Tax=Nocardiopsis coralli TaxID=2772213 RepID=A0ABR9PF31_9ACTN|nr:alpha/beta fold hydrolase [Nocardiopsis coralli]MBE3002433.1 alpha/beta fold hydrolase [Nocardiopsis coralli]
MPMPPPTGHLPLTHGHTMAYYTTGNPHARPTLALHGGPGSGANPGYAHFLDTTRHHLIQYDQRGCGNSTPDAAHPHTDLTTNTTTHLIDDIETLRTHLGIDTWHLLGASWGTTLALAYAQTHPHRVRALTLISVTTTSPHEIHWLTHQMRHVFPEAWQHFRDAAGPEADPHHLAHAYAQLLHDPDPTTRDRAARAWCTWEDTHVATHPHHRPNPRYQDPHHRYRFARLVTHYWSHHAFLEHDQLIHNAHRLHGTPGALIHGRMDISSPASTAHTLARAWPDATLTICEDAAHISAQTDMLAAARRATDRFT